MRPTFRDRRSEPRTFASTLRSGFTSATVADAASWRCKAQDELACGSGLFRAGESAGPWASNPHARRATMPAVRVTTRRYSFSVVRDADATYPNHAPVNSPREAVDIARHIIGEEITECILVLFVNARNRISGYAEVARGTINAARLQPRDVLVPALCANAAGLIVCHNHPSADATPSRADRVVTAALRNAAQIVGLPLLDHIIVTDTEHFSFRSEEGWE
jgi:DNA repair protein RadC